MFFIAKRKSLRTKSPSTESTPQKEKTAKSHVDNESDMAELLSQYLDTGKSLQHLREWIIMETVAQSFLI